MADNFFKIVHEVEDYDISKKLQSIVDRNFKSRAKKRKVRNVAIVISVLLLFSFLAYNFQQDITGLTVEGEPEDGGDVVEEVVEEEPEEEVVDEEPEEEETETEGETDSAEIPTGGDKVSEDEEGGGEDGDVVEEEAVEEEIEEEESEIVDEDAGGEDGSVEIPAGVDGSGEDEGVDIGEGAHPPTQEDVEEEEEVVDEEREIEQAPKLIKNIPDYKFNRGGFIVIDVSEYFSNADEFYFLQVEGITSTISSNLILVRAGGGFEGTRRVNIVAENEFGKTESNFFNIVVYVGDVARSEMEVPIPEEEVTVPEINITVPEVDVPEVNVTAPEVPVNITPLGEVNISTRQYKAVINRPTKWIKTVKAESVEQAREIDIELPKEARNISVKTGLEVQQAIDEIEKFETTIKNADKKDLISNAITGNVAYDIKEGQGFLTRFFNWFKRFTITGQVISEEELKADITETLDKKIVDLENIVNQTQATEIAVEYYTQGPTAVEEITSRGKRVIVSGNDALNYTEILAFAEIPEKYDVGEEGRIKIYWEEERRYVNFTAYDLNANGKLDYVEWITPHLSNQTFDIILITKAEHLDSNREFISDIYDEVKALDGNWSEEIPNQDYVRVIFEVNLTSVNDITLYPRTITGNPRIEVYEIGGTELIAEFSSLTDNEYNTILLTNLQGSQGTFDLRVIGGSVEIEHIIDPPAKVNDASGSCSPTTIDDSGTQTTDCAFVMLNAGNTFSVQCTITITDDGTGNPITNVCQGGIQFKVDSIAFGNGGANNECLTDNGDGSVDCGATWNSGSDSEDVTWTLSGCNGDNTASTIQLEASCNDGLNDKPLVTVNTAGDTIYPTFSSFTEAPPNASTTYSASTFYQFNATVLDTNGTVGVEVNGVNYTATNLTANVYNLSVESLPGDAFTYYWWGYGNGTSNNLNVSTARGYTINESVPEGTLTNTDAWTVTFPEEVTIGLSESNEGDGDLTYIVHRDDVAKGTGETVTLGVASYNYVLNTTGGQNYTENVSMEEQTLTVNAGASELNLTIGGVEGNATTGNNTALLLNGTLITGDAGATLRLYNNGTLINEGTTEVSNTTTFIAEGWHNITVLYIASNNYTASSRTFWVNVTPVTNVAPQITNVTVITAKDPLGDGIRSITFNFTVVDTDGAGDLNNESATAEFLRTNEPTRTNTTCSSENIDDNSNRYICTIGMYYFDENGAWTINVTINDSAGERVGNATTSFTYNLLTAMKMSPTALDWSGLTITSTNVASDSNPITINNTGNDVITVINVTAIDLAGETTITEYIYAGNFTVNTIAASDNTTMINGTSVQVDVANLTRGNHTIADGKTGQEELYFYLEALNSDISSQSYSSTGGGEWTVAILTAAAFVIGGGRRRKKEEELLEDLSLPSAIFTKKLGCLEAIVKYMKEDLRKSHHEIAKILNRDDRTIWTAHRKAMEKEPEKVNLEKTIVTLPIMKLEKTFMLLPTSIFKNRKLTTLEAIIVYLKDNGLKNSEIARLLNRDQRNIWTTYQKAENKLDNKTKEIFK